MSRLVNTMLATFLSLLVSIMAYAQSGNVAGRVVSVANKPYTVDESGTIRNQLARRSEVYAGDTIFTESNGMIQIRMIDSAVISLQCNSALKIEDYWYEEDPAKDLVTIRLLSGRFRTITGAIGEQNADRYRFYVGDSRVEIRGTDFEVFTADGSTAYFGNFNGSIKIVNTQGEVILGIGGNGDFAKVESGEPPVVISQYPQQFSNLWRNTLENPRSAACRDPQANANRSSRREYLVSG